MKIVVVTHYFWPENLRQNDIVYGLVERGHEVTVYTGIPNYPGGRYFPGYGFFGPLRETHAGVRVRRAPLIARGGGGRLRLALNYASHAFFATVLAPWLVRGAFDAILVFALSPNTIGIPGRALRALKRAPMVLWLQDLWPESLAASGTVRNPAVLGAVGRLVRWIYQGSDRVLVQSMAFIPAVEARGVPRERIAYLPNSAESFYRRIRPSPDDPEAHELPAGFRIMFAGSMGAAQDFPTILSAAEQLRERKDIQWIIVGDGRIRPWVESEVRARALESTFHLLGQRPAERMPRYFAHADVLLATLRCDPIFAYTIPSKLQSYLACGKPVIVALEGEGGRIVRESGAGWVVPPENPQALAEAVLAACGLSKEEREAMGDRGEACFREEFEREKLLSRLEQELIDITRPKT